MRLTHFHIQNFRSCRDVILKVGGIHALVGANNSGKSSVLRALDFLFNPSTKNLNEESFWNNDTRLEIRVEAIFSNFTEKEKDALGPYLPVDGPFHMGRLAKLGGKGGDAEADAESCKLWDRLFSLSSFRSGHPAEYEPPHQLETMPQYQRPSVHDFAAPDPHRLSSNR